MAGKEEITEQFVAAMFGLVKAIKIESDHCCKICGGVNEKELMIIVFVGQNESATMSGIADNLEAPLSTLTTIVDKLVANQYLSRHNSDEDRRVVKVALAEKGKASFQLFLNQKKVMAKKVLGQFSQTDKSLLVLHLHKLAAAINSKK